MDPTQTLADVLRMAADIAEGRSDEEDSKELAELVLELDYWLLRGGALPATWTR